MKHEDFILKCRRLVREDICKRFATEENKRETFEVFVVWSCKTLQNSKAILSATTKGAPLYEFTLNGDKGEIYVDTYIKESNECIQV